MNINDYAPRHINLDVEKLKAPKYVGTFTELYGLVKDGKVSLVTHDDGRVIGIYVESGASNLMLENLAGENFKNAYCGKPVQTWVELLVSAIHFGKDVSDINEENGTCAIDGEIITYDESKASRSATNSRDLPESLELDIEKDLWGDASIASIKAYLRETYDHYLSGLAVVPFKIEAGKNEGTVFVTDICWGRKR